MLPSELPTASSLSSQRLQECDNFTDLSVDLARAAISSSLPLWGKDDVCRTFADALVAAIESPSDIMGFKAITGLLEQTSSLISHVQLVDLVYRNLCERTIAMRSIHAAASASLLAVQALPADTTIPRLRVFVYDIVYALGHRRLETALRLVVEVLRHVPGGGAILFSRDRTDFDVLQATVWHTLEACAQKKELPTEFDAAALHCCEIFGRSDSKYSEAFSPKSSCNTSGSAISPWAATALRLTLDSDDEKFFHSAALAIALEARIIGPLKAYEVILLKHIWPAISDVSKISDMRDDGFMRACDYGKRAARALNVLGLVLNGMFPVENVQLEAAIASVEVRLAKLLKCNDLPHDMRSAIARTLTSISEGSRISSGRSSSHKTNAASRASAVIEALNQWRQAAISN
jgi:hypothetical protein